jgi:GTPase SAR1 family protein
MDSSNWTDILPTALKLPLQAYTKRKELQHWWKKAQAFLDVGATNVLVVGRPSVGKSVLLSTLYGEVNDITFDLPGRSNTVETGTLQLDKWTRLIRVAPGQTSVERSIAITEALTKNDNLEGVIYVTDFGFTDYRDHTAKKIEINDRNVDTVKKIRSQNIKAELEDFSYFIDRLVDQHLISSRPLWLLIVVNKADLYSNNLSEAESYYHIDGNSPFSAKLKLVEQKLGQAKIRIASVPVCSYEKDFTWNKETVKSEVGGTQARKAYVRNLLRLLTELSSR